MTKDSCTCKTCEGACKSKPGWFKFGEAEKAAEYLGLTLKEFFDKHLMVDFWKGDDASSGQDTFLLSPAVVGGTPGKMFSMNPRGVCTFLQEGLCSIHPVKPFECKQYHHNTPREKSRENHKQAMQTWMSEEARAQITELIGNEPSLPDFDIFEFMKAFA